MSEATCIACGTPLQPWRTAVIDPYTRESFAIDRCPRCALGVTRPVPVDLNRYYPARYRVDRHGFTGRQRVAMRARQAERAAGTPRDGRRLIDLGAGNGAFALQMQQRGWTVGVTELDQDALHRFHAAGLQAVSPDDTGQLHGEADVITCWHVLEHVPDPATLLDLMRSKLAEHGVAIITVPNANSWQARLFGRRWFHLDVPRHLFHFTPQSLRMLLDRHGLRLLTQRTFAWEYDYFGWIQSPLNAINASPNVLFERLTVGDAPPGTPAKDRAVHYLGGPLMAGLTALPCALSWPAGAGATLTVTCERA